MEKPIKLSNKEKWQAVIDCDIRYDGVFFYGVKTTGIFCRPSCKAKTPSVKNVYFFDSAVDAITEGFRPCKKCRPDIEVFDPDMELVNKTKDILILNYDKVIDLNIISRQLGVSTNHLRRLFKQNCGITPKQYIIKLRLDKSLELLEQSDINIIEISYIAGFKSLSNFYKYFKERIGKTPNEYRKEKLHI